MQQKCTHCQEEKDFDSFYKAKCGTNGLMQQCKKCYNLLRSGRQKKRWKEDEAWRKEQIAIRLKNYYQKREEKDEVWRNKCIERSKQWKASNPERNKQLQNKSAQKRRQNFKYQINNKIRARIYYHINKNHLDYLIPFVNYTIQELKDYISGLFIEGMSWDNWGEWQIDHIEAICKFDYSSTDDGQFKKCWALENLQPLWAKDNIAKSFKDRGFT